MKLLAGELAPASGTVETAARPCAWRTSPRTRPRSPGDLRVLESLEAVKGAATLSDGVEITAGLLCDRFGFRGDRARTLVRDLSGGERRRLQLMRLLMDGPNVLLLDEPTNDLDIDTLTALEDLLDGWPGTLVVVSHDRYFVERVCDDVYALTERGGIRHLPGGIEQYLEERRAAEAAAAAPRAAAAGERRRAPGRGRPRRAQGRPAARARAGEARGSARPPCTRRWPRARPTTRGSPSCRTSSTRSPPSATSSRRRWLEASELLEELTGPLGGQAQRRLAAERRPRGRSPARGARTGSPGRSAQPRPRSVSAWWSCSMPSATTGTPSALASASTAPVIASSLPPWPMPEVKLRSSLISSSAKRWR